MNKPEIPEVDRIAAMLLVQEGYTYAQIAEKLKISKGAISKIKKRLDETGSYKNRLRSGRLIISTQADNRQLVHLIRKNRMSVNFVIASVDFIIRPKGKPENSTPPTIWKKLFMERSRQETSTHQGTHQWSISVLQTTPVVAFWAVVESSI